ncbi:hypothetical protein GCM10023322_31570 [Rugosimonospora acidiphila]|uniref:Uncharacterized protein n=1 Tax=Rugosimonospora acidiphila TaxID=556531 RepID=A0ABP9RS56_9ACTN
MPGDGRLPQQRAADLAGQVDIAQLPQQRMHPLDITGPDRGNQVFRHSYIYLLTDRSNRRAQAAATCRLSGTAPTTHPVRTR